MCDIKVRSIQVSTSSILRLKFCAHKQNKTCTAKSGLAPVSELDPGVVDLGVCKFLRDTEDVGPTWWFNRDLNSTKTLQFFCASKVLFLSDSGSAPSPSPHLVPSRPSKSIQVPSLLGGVQGRVGLRIQSLGGLGRSHWIQIIQVFQLWIRIFLQGLFVGILRRWDHWYHWCLRFR